MVQVNVKPLTEVFRDFSSKTLDEVIDNGWLCIKVRDQGGITSDLLAFLINTDSMTKKESEEFWQFYHAEGFVSIVEWQELHYLLNQYGQLEFDKAVKEIVFEIDYYFKNNAWLGPIPSTS